MERFDLIVLGAGSAARDGTRKAAREFGASVALVESTRWGAGAGVARLDGPTARLEDGRTVDAARVLLASGRAQNVEELGLDRIGVRTHRGGIEVNERMRTTANGIWTAGDVTGLAQFTPVAQYQPGSRSRTCSRRTDARLTTPTCRPRSSPTRSSAPLA